MSYKTNTQRQLMLFQRRLAWDEFPTEVCDEVTRLLTTLCVEITVNPPSPQEEHQYERPED